MSEVEKESSPGQQYFLAKKRRKIAEDLASDKSASICSAAVDRLCTLATELAPIACKETTTGDRENIFATAMLVDPKALSLVLEQLRQIELCYANYHTTSELSGPWPPYSFVSLLA